MANQTTKRLLKKIADLKNEQAAAVRFAGQHKKRADFIQTAFRTEAPDQYAAWMAKQRIAGSLKSPKMDWSKLPTRTQQVVPMKKKKREASQ